MPCVLAMPSLSPGPLGGALMPLVLGFLFWEELRPSWVLGLLTTHPAWIDEAQAGASP